MDNTSHETTTKTLSRRNKDGKRCLIMAGKRFKRPKPTTASTMPGIEKIQIFKKTRAIAPEEKTIHFN